MLWICELNPDRAILAQFPSIPGAPESQTAERERTQTRGEIRKVKHCVHAFAQPQRPGLERGRSLLLAAVPAWAFELLPCSLQSPVVLPVLLAQARRWFIAPLAAVPHSPFPFQPHKGSMCRALLGRG